MSENNESNTTCTTTTTVPVHPFDLLEQEDDKSVFSAQPPDADPFDEMAEMMDKTKKFVDDIVLPLSRSQRRTLHTISSMQGQVIGLTKKMKAAQKQRTKLRANIIRMACEIMVPSDTLDEHTTAEVREHLKTSLSPNIAWMEEHDVDRMDVVESIKRLVEMHAPFDLR
jgi:hypothetical protein